MIGASRADVDAMLPPRYHGLDALRAAMMLLGLVLHAAASYTRRPIADGWPYHDAHTHVFADLTAYFIHIFRMPAFFVAAGFFAALLHERHGGARFVRHRVRRLVVPLALFWPFLLATVISGFAFAQWRGTGAIDPYGMDPSLPWLRRPVLIHLWFLYHLIILCVGAALVAWLGGQAPARWRQLARRAAAGLLSSRRGSLVLIALTWLTLLPMPEPGIETSAALLPPSRVLVANGVFFAYGWLLYAWRPRLGRFGTVWRSRLSAAVLAGAASITVMIMGAPQHARLTFVAACALRSVSMWLFIFGWLGLFVRHMDQPRPFVRYLADASYWMYLVHLPVVIWMAGLLAPVDWPAIAKFAIVLSVTTATTAGTYRWFVRSTAIGALLNGRRYPRGLPRASSAGVPAPPP